MASNINQANVTWARGASTASAKVERLADTTANRAKLQTEAAATKLPTVLAKQGGDVLLLSGATLQTASRSAQVSGASINTGDSLMVDGAAATVFGEDDGFSKIDTQGVIVAVIDTGLDVNHPALKGRVVSPYNVLTGTKDVTDNVGHGTHVAGIIAGATDTADSARGSDYNGGVDTNARIMPIKVSDTHGGFLGSNVSEGIRYAVDHGAKVINMSLGGGNWMPFIQDALKYADSKGVVVVGAMGNDGKGRADYPAKFDNVVAVGSSKNGVRSTFSNYGDRTDVTANGEKINSTLPGGKYGVKSGTSMSAPYVAGEAALIIAQHPEWTPAQVRQQIDAATNGTSWNTDTGYGEANLFKAVYGQNLTPVSRTAQAAQPQHESFIQKLLAFFHLG